MSAAGSWLGEEALRKLYRSSVRDPLRIREILESARAQRVVLHAGCNRLTQARTARIAALGEDRLVLETRHFGEAPLPQIPLSFALDDVRWFFVAVPVGATRPGELRVRIPSVLYEPERRDLARSAPAAVARAPQQIGLSAASGSRWQARVLDWSYHGMAVELPESPQSEDELEIDTPEAVPGAVRYAWVRNRAPGSRPGWTRLGLRTSAVASRGGVTVERWNRVPPRPRPEPAGRRLLRAVRGMASQLAEGRSRSGPEGEVPVFEFRNGRGERLRAIVDRVGEQPGAPLVLIPPAWGRTKETVAPLALTILESFRAIGSPISVLRFDGTRRRGESFNDPECLRPGDESLHFTFSGAVDDIRAALEFAEASDALRPSAIAVVSSSLASIEARRALAEADESRIAGWVSLVGLIDLHTVLRAVSGGVDYGLGVLRQVEFGVQDLFGVRCDIDRLVADAIESGLWFLEDARRDLASIRAPVTWLHGSHDAWTALANVRDAMSCGITEDRRILQLPIGHQLRSSAEALAVFRVVAAEVGRMLTGRTIRAREPRRKLLERREQAERRRLALPHFDLRRFWRDYLVGRTGELGMELLTSTASYQELMAAQVEALDLSPGDVVADLGTGVGDLAVLLQDRRRAGLDVGVHAFDYVPEALARLQQRIDGGRGGPGVDMILADLGVGEGLALPVRALAYDAVLASLLLTYLPEPEAFLAEVLRVTKPGGRLVVSTIRPDTDVSRLYLDSIEELAPERLEELFGRELAGDAARLRRTFLSDASRILDLEEFGYFRFWDEDALARMIADAGFVRVTTTRAFGDPPQAIIARALRP